MTQLRAPRLRPAKWSVQKQRTLASSLSLRAQVLSVSAPKVQVLSVSGLEDERPFVLVRLIGEEPTALDEQISRSENGMASTAEKGQI